MCIPEPERGTPEIQKIIIIPLVTVKMSEAEMHVLLCSLDDTEAVGQDSISPCLLNQCAQELERPLARLFNQFLQTSS